ncbi:MAG: hypothetical protein RSE05_07870 [Clostridium sp.]
MLNEEKIRLMTDIAVFEKKNGRKMSGITGYFKNDYISRNMIKGFLSYTLCGMLILVIWILFNMDLFLSTIGLDALISVGKKIVVFYAVGLVLYMALVYAVYAKRYDYEIKKNRIYTSKLKHLDKRYDYHNRSRELTREGKRI